MCCIYIYCIERDIWIFHMHYTWLGYHMVIAHLLSGMHTQVVRAVDMSTCSTWPASKRKPSQSSSWDMISSSGQVLWTFFVDWPQSHAQTRNLLASDCRFPMAASKIQTLWLKNRVIWDRWRYQACFKRSKARVHRRPFVSVASWFQCERQHTGQLLTALANLDVHPNNHD